MHWVGWEMNEGKGRGDNLLKQGRRVWEDMWEVCSIRYKFLDPTRGEKGREGRGGGTIHQKESMTMLIGGHSTSSSYSSLYRGKHSDICSIYSTRCRIICWSTSHRRPEEDRMMSEKGHYCRPEYCREWKKYSHQGSRYSLDCTWSQLGIETCNHLERGHLLFIILCKMQVLFRDDALWSFIETSIHRQ